MKRMDQWVNEACGEELKRVKPIPVDEQAVLTKTLEKLGLSQEKLPWQEKGTPDFEALEPVLVEYPEPEKKRSWTWRLAQAAVACFALFLVGYMVSPAISGLLGSGGGPGAAGSSVSIVSALSEEQLQEINERQIKELEEELRNKKSHWIFGNNVELLNFSVKESGDMDLWVALMDEKFQDEAELQKIELALYQEKDDGTRERLEDYGTQRYIPENAGEAGCVFAGCVFKAPIPEETLFLLVTYQGETLAEFPIDVKNQCIDEEALRIQISPEEAYFNVENASGLAVWENNTLRLSLRADTNLNPNSKNVQYFYSLALDGKVMDEYKDTSLNSFRQWEWQEDGTWLNQRVEIPLTKSFLNQFAEPPEEGFLNLVTTYVYQPENGEEQHKQFTQTLTFKLEGDFPKAPVVGNLTGDKTGVEGIISAEQLKAEQEMLEEMLKMQEKAQSNELFHIGNCVVGNVELKNFSVEGESKAAGALVKLLDEKFQDEAELQEVELALYREKDDGTRERLGDHGTQRYISGGDTSVVGCEFKGPVSEETLFLVVTYQEETLAEFPIDVKNQCIDEAAFAEKNGGGVVSAIGGQEARIIITSDDKVYTTGDDTTLTISGNRVKITKAR